MWNFDQISKYLDEIAKLIKILQELLSFDFKILKVMLYIFKYTAFNCDNNFQAVTPSFDIFYWKQKYYWRFKSLFKSNKHMQKVVQTRFFEKIVFWQNLSQTS